MILKFLKNAPSKNGKKYKANTQAAITDYDYGNMLVDKGLAIRVDNIPNTVGEIVKEQKGKTKKEK